MSHHIVIRTRWPGLSLRMPARAAAATAIAALALLVAICLATAFGFYPISPFTVVRSLAGASSSINVYIVQQVRLPRVLEGALVGAALALSGAIFQSLSRNPLASPDVLGINQGAGVVAVWLILAGAPYAAVPVGSFAGALAVIVVLALLAVRRRFSVSRLLLIGLAVNVFCGAITGYLLTRPAPTQRVFTAQQWLYGSVASADWQDTGTVALALAVVAPLVLVLGRQLNVFALGDDLAASLGVRTNRLRLALTGLAALLAAVVVSVAGPIGFVAFISPHIARRLARTSGSASLPMAMLTGALLTLAADFAAKRLLEPTELPVGITTIFIGAPYLLYLLVRTERDAGVG